MYFLIADSGAPPTVETKYEFVHKDGILDRSHGNSWRKILEVVPLISLTALWMPNWGSTSISKCTWSGRTSISMRQNPRSMQIS